MTGRDSPAEATTVPPATGPAALLRWLANPYVQIGLGALLVTASELLLKKGAALTATGPAATGPAAWFGVAALGSGWTWAGIVCYVLSFVSWLHVLRHVPLSIAFALINVVHVLVPVGAWLVLHEAISGRRWAGIGLVLCGILLVARPAARAEEEL